MAEKLDEVEREYVIPLRRKWEKAPKYKRAKKAIRAIREFLARHMKVRDRDLNKIKVDRFLNEEVWFRGIKNPPSKIKVKAIKKGGIVRAELAVLPNKLKFKKAREEKAEKKSEEAGKKHEVEKPAEEKKESEGAPPAISHTHRQEKESIAPEKKETTIEAMEKFEKESSKRMKQQKGDKVDKMQQIQTKKKNLKSR